MLIANGVLVLAELALLVYCVLDIVTTPEGATRNLPKLLWLFLVIVLPLIGGIAWLVAGRPQGSAGPRRGARVPAAHDRPGRAAASNPDDDADFLRQLNQRAEEQRRAAEKQRRAAMEAEEAERKAAGERSNRSDSDDDGSPTR